MTRPLHPAESRARTGNVPPTDRLVPPVPAFTFALALVLALALGLASAARADEPAAHAKGERKWTAPHSHLGTDAVAETLDVVEVTDTFERSLARVSSANQGVVSRAQVLARPSRRAGDILETVPGLVISQHSGEGKANQYYLRGFNLDHGTDFATSIAGLPVNMPTHGHGQGYSDLSFVIPELVGGIQYRKGPYYADEGDFSTAGAANITYRNTLERAIGEASMDKYGYRRGVAGASVKAGGGDLLFSAEGLHNDGPWDLPDDYRKLNGVVRFSRNGSEGGLSLSLMGYDGRWNATDQIPERAVSQGRIGRYGTIDPTDGGTSSRYSLSGEWQRVGATRLWRASAYVIDYRMDLFSNFTYFLDDTTNGDQFEQFDDRTVVGGRVSHTWTNRWWNRPVESTLGVSLRHDHVRKVGLYATAGRDRLSTTREDRVLESAGGAFAQASVQVSPVIRTVLGLRADGTVFDVTSDEPLNSGERSAGILSPKLSLMFGPWDRTAYFLNLGLGFHSNDARGTVTTVDPKSGEPVAPVDPLVRTRGAEVGVRTAIVPGLSTSLSLWALGIDSELLFVGDAGTTEATRPSRRMGLEWSAVWTPAAARGLALDAELALSDARFTDDDPAGDRIPGAVGTVIAAGAAYESAGPLFGSLRLRSLGPRPLVEDNSVRSNASTTLAARVGYRFRNGLRLSVEGLNLTNARTSDIDYYYESRLPGEPAEGVADLHSHPLEPFTLRLALSATTF
ncbi:MAG: TonB-dependent receptor [Candidatus Eiseniibacteriota bacterium]